MAELLTVSEAADRLGLSAKAIQRRIERGTIQSVKREGRRFVPGAEVERVRVYETAGAAGEISEGTNSPAGDFSVMLARIEELAAENGRFRALQEVAETTRQQIEDELLKTRAQVTELKAQLAELPAAPLAPAETPRRRWFKRS